jgi:hypothetical protein
MLVGVHNYMNDADALVFHNQMLRLHIDLAKHGYRKHKQFRLIC